MSTTQSALTEQEWLNQQKDEAKPSLELTVNKFMIDHDLNNIQMTELLGDYIEQIKPNKNIKC